MFRLAKHGLLQRETWPFALPFAASCGSVCSSGVKVLMATGRRRRPTFLNRMWSEAQLAVSNGHKHRPRRGRMGFWIERSYGYVVMRYAPKLYNRNCCSPSSRTAYSVTAYRKFRSRWSLHMRLSKVRPLSGTGSTFARHTPKARTSLLLRLGLQLIRFTLIYNEGSV